MQNVARKAEGEGAGEPRTPSRARFGRPSADRVPRFLGLAFPDTHPGPRPTPKGRQFSSGHRVQGARCEPSTSLGSVPAGGRGWKGSSPA